MTSEQTLSMTAADFGTVAQKLEQFNRGLSTGEQAVLAELLRQAVQAAGGDSEVSGYGMATVAYPEGDVLKAFGLS